MPALAAFEHGHDYFFILFEYAENTLEGLLNSAEPIFHSQQLWKQVQGLASGLAHMHCIPVSNGLEKAGQMVHRDLKPANVLIVGCVMKIADFGFADWNPGSTESYSASGDYLAYGACNNYCPLSGGDVSDKYDVYSLGAMVSEIACFDLCGAQGVERYRQRRYADVVLPKTNSWRFHYYNLGDMKESVAKEHKRLLSDVHSSMSPWQQVFYQEKLFDLVESMIRGSAADRPTAAHVENTLNHFNEMAHINAAYKSHQMQPDVVGKWLETLGTVQAKTENRL